MCANAVGKAGRVIAVEPNPEFVQLLERSVALNGYAGRVCVKEVALAANCGTALFNVSDDSDNSGVSSLVDHGAFRTGSHAIEVHTTTLDRLCEEMALGPLRLVKIDVERAEDAVLAGSNEVLRRRQVDYFIVEIVSGTRSQAVLTGAGYEGYLIDADRHSLVPLGEVGPGRFGDYLFKRQGLLTPS
jgi:FkbM family methyltransferase